MDAMLWELLANGSPDDQVEVLIKLSDIAHIPDNVLDVVARIGNIASCRIRRGDIEEIRARKWVLSMKASRPLTLDPPLTEEEASLPDAEKTEQSRRPDTPFTGKGVCIGIADWGFDFTHPNFLDADGETRFKAIWDQGTAYDGSNSYGYGTVYHENDIAEALTSDKPFEALNYNPAKSDFFHQGMHGTHVLDIAAGSGAVGDTGIAPSADLIAVHLATDQFQDLMGLGDSVRVFDAIHFLDRAAGARPLVINMSVGSHGDAHMGRSLIEQAIDHLVTSRMDRSLVQSCGNYYKARIHCGGMLTTGGQQQLEWLISRSDNTPNELEVWFGSEDQFEVDLRSPSGNFVLRNQGLGKTDLHEFGKEIGRFYYRTHEPNTDLSQILIILNESALPGAWEIRLYGKNVRNGRFEMYIERDAQSGHQSRFSQEQARPGMTTGSICNGFYNISVGAINPENDAIGAFSSVGPTWDGREKPDLAAPGVSILAAKSASPFEPASSGELTVKTGTSMAAPFVAGAVALLYEALGRPASIREVKRRLFAACRPPQIENETLKSRFGHGILDLKRLLDGLTHHSFHHSTNSAIMYSNNDHNSKTDYLREIWKEHLPELTEENLDQFYEMLPGESLSDLQPGDYLFRRVHGQPQPTWGGIVEYIDQDEAWVRTPKALKRVNVARSAWELKRVKAKPLAKKQPPKPRPEPEPELEPEVPDAPDGSDLETPAAEFYPSYEDFEEAHPDQVKVVVTWSGYYNDTIAANVQITESANRSRIVGAGSGSNRAEVIVPWRKKYRVIVNPTAVAPDNYYTSTSEIISNTIAETATGTPSLQVDIRLILYEENNKNVEKSWEIKGVNAVEGKKTQNVSLMGFNPRVNKLVVPRVIQTQAAFNALPPASQLQITNSLGSMGGYNFRTQKRKKRPIMSLHSLGCAIDVNENMGTDQNTDFGLGNRDLLDLVEAIVRLQPGKSNFNIGTAQGLDQLNASILFNSVFPTWLYQRITTLVPPPPNSPTPATPPSPGTYTKEQLDNAIKKAKENGERSNANLLTIVKRHQRSLAAWIDGTPKRNTILYGMIPMDPLFLTLMLDNGWAWGGNYDRNEKDYMHFEDVQAKNTLLAPPEDDPAEEYGDEDYEEYNDENYEDYSESALAEAKDTPEEKAIVKALNLYNPVRSDTIVINKEEFITGIPGIKNYRDWAKNKSTTPHNEKLKEYRKPLSIIHLVLHETAANTGDGYDNTLGYTAHLSVKNETTILQFNDLLETEYHGNALNGSSIGIEFVNRSWLSSTTEKGGEGIPAKEASLTPAQKEKFKETNGYLWAFWGAGFNIYRLPKSIDHLEKDVTLITWLTAGLKVNIYNQAISLMNLNVGKIMETISKYPSIDQTWLQLVSYNEVQDVWRFKTDDIPEETDRNKKNFFVMTTGYGYLEPSFITKKSGIISHNAFNDGHSDGSFLSLYSWLRLQKGKTPAKAFELCKKLMKEHYLKVNLKSNKDKNPIILLDVQDAHLV